MASTRPPEPDGSGGAGRERLQKVLAAAGVASRRACEELIAAGRVTVNGAIARLGDRVDPARDEIAVDGVAVHTDVSKRYIMLNKPVGVVSSMADERGRRDLREFTRDIPERVFNVGRLDADTSGLLLLTNDGELAHVLAHPSFGVEKTYLATVRGVPKPATLKRLREGIELDDGPIRADRVRLVGEPSQGRAIVEITLHSGRNRIVRRMLDGVGHPVLELVRRRFGPLRLGTLASGRWRDLTKLEVGALLTLARQAARPGPDGPHPLASQDPPTP